jgi:hypothetical protein
VFQGGSCGRLALEGVSKSQVGSNWVISFTVGYVTPYAGWPLKVTASCTGFSVSKQISSTPNGIVASSIEVPTASCGSGTLTVEDANVGTVSGPW